MRRLLLVALVTLVALVAACKREKPAAKADPPPAHATTRRALAILDMGGCVIASDARVVCWDVKLSPWAFDPIEGGAKLVSAPRDIRHRVCAVSGKGEVFCSEGVHPSKPAMRRVAGVEAATDLSVDERYGCAVVGAGRVVCFVGGPPSVEPIAMGIEDATEVQVFGEYGCALHKSGRVSCWQHPSKPSDVGLSEVAHLGTGHRPCVVHFDGRATCWDHAPMLLPEDPYGAERNAETRKKAKPTIVAGLTNAHAITRGDGFSCALLTDGAVTCGGRNTFGYLGRGNWEDGPHGPRVIGVSDATEVGSYAGSTCARTSKGAVLCWGSRFFRGDGPMYAASPQPVVSASPSIEIACGLWGTCSRTTRGGVECWGSDHLMTAAKLRKPIELPTGIERHVEWMAEPQPMPFDDVVSLRANGTFCALTRGGAVYCFGDIGDRGPRPPEPKVEKPSRILPTDGGVCFETDKLLCVGSSRFRFANACSGKALKEPWDPEIALPLGAPIALGNGLICGLLDGGKRLRCLRIDTYGKCETGTIEHAAGGAPFESVASSGEHACVVDRDGGVHCFGSNARGQLGRDGSGETFGVVADLPPARSVVMGYAHTCALTKTGEVYCFGANGEGQLGDGRAGVTSIARDPKLRAADRSKPARVEGLAKVTQLAARGGHTCALLGDGAIKCWGSNEHGELGVGGRERTYATSAIEVFAPDGKRWNE